MCSSLRSHPNKYLEDHINGCLKVFRNNINGLNIDKKLIKAAEIAIVCHDIGKATEYFQEYIKGQSNRKSNHSLLSSVFAFYITKEVLKDEKLSLYNFIACKRHHSNLWNSEDGDFLYYEATIGNNYSHLKEQVDSIDFQKFLNFVNALDVDDDIKKALKKFASKDKDEFCRLFCSIDEELKNALKKFDSKKKVCSLINSLINSIYKELNKININNSLKEYLNFMFIYSSLLFSDKIDAVLPSNHNFSIRFFDKFDKDESLVSNYKSSLPKNYSISSLREDAYNKVLEKDISALLNNGERFFSITLPTGMGKTLTGFAFALKLRKFLKDRGRGEFKIIYSLPFLSIIDQNFDVIYGVVSKGVGSNSVSSDILLKHHHLSDFKYSINNASEDFGRNVSKMFVETWNTNVVITTFVQFFHSLITNQNSFAKRFIRVAKSIIILDEVQAIPYKYWDLFRELIKEYAKKFDIYVILMTATQPKILDTVELVGDPSYYFDQLDRIKFSYDSKERNICDFLRDFGCEIKRFVREGKKVLIIANTINSSREIFNKLSVNKKTYLSSFVIPKHRLERIKEIKDGKYDVVVSTQVVEAGVDIDFDVVYRDFAPMDSLIQSAGRCNRNNNRGKGLFKIVCLVDQNNNNKPFYSYIYDRLLCYYTKKVIGEFLQKSTQNNISEKDFHNIVKNYFSMISIKSNKGFSKEILDSLKELNFNKISSFQLIEDQYYKVDVFVEWDDEAKSVWKELCSIENKIKQATSRNDFFNAFNEYEGLKFKVHQYVVSVPEKLCNGLDKGFFDTYYYVPKKDVGNYYDSLLGFKGVGKNNTCCIW